MKFLLKTFFVIERILTILALLFIFALAPNGESREAVSTMLVILLSIIFLITGISTIFDSLKSRNGTTAIVGIVEIVLSFLLLSNMDKANQNELFATLASATAVILAVIFVIRQINEIQIISTWQLNNNMSIIMKLSLFLFPAFVFARLLYYVYALFTKNSIATLNVITIILLIIAVGLLIIESYLHLKYRDWDAYPSRLRGRR